MKECIICKQKYDPTQTRTGRFVCSTECSKKIPIPKLTIPQTQDLLDKLYIPFIKYNKSDYHIEINENNSHLVISYDYGLEDYSEPDLILFEIIDEKDKKPKLISDKETKGNFKDLKEFL